MPDLSLDEQRIADEAFAIIKGKESELIEKFANPHQFTAADKAVALFMAGAPGAGKTEVSKHLSEEFKSKPVRIDADEIRESIPGYRGSHAHIYQHAAVRGVDMLLNHVFRKNYNFILDGTFAYQGAVMNIKRALNHKRKVDIYYVYQDPVVAWDFTNKREELEHRRVTRDVFIKAYLTSIANIRQVKKQFGSDIQLNVVVKDISKEQVLENLELNVNTLDPYLDSQYTQEVLEGLIQ
ncbi:MAG: zeta toxin family protein [Patescibacteria group bacterium]